MPKADELIPALTGQIVPVTFNTDQLTAMVAERNDLQQLMKGAYSDYQKYTQEVANLNDRIQRMLKDMGAI